jgi:F-type H+-transporting ATPase subunit epsilon
VSETFHCSIVTPSEKIFDEAVSYVSFPSWDGQHGVMAGQSPMLSALAIGPVRVDLPGGESRWWLLDGGFAQVQSRESGQSGPEANECTLTLLTASATAADELSVEEAEKLLAEASGRVTSAGTELAQVERDQQRALAGKALARTHGNA